MAWKFDGETMKTFKQFNEIQEGLFSTLSGAFRTAFDKIYDDPLKPIDPPKEHKPTERPSSVKVNSVKARTRNRLSKKYK